VGKTWWPRRGKQNTKAQLLKEFFCSMAKKFTNLKRLFESARFFSSVQIFRPFPIEAG